MANSPQSVQFSRMTREQALQALTVLGIQARTHALTCATCWHAAQAKKQRAQQWSTWVPCDVARATARTRLALEHRLRYLLNQYVKQAAAAYGLSPWQFQQQKPSEYAEIARQYGEE